MQHSLNIYLYIATGGAIGACLRYFLTQMATQWFGKGFPFGTLLVNVIGAFSIGLLYSLIEQKQLSSSMVESQAVLWRSAIGIGLLGALTTFSTFSYDNFVLLQQGLWLKGLLNIFLNVVCCLAAVWLATQLVKG